MSDVWIAGLVAVFAWWFSTGAILATVRLADAGGRRAHVWAVLLGTPVLVLGAGLFVDTLSRPEVGAVYAAFLSALLIWGWIEMAFLCGVVAGPNRGQTPSGVSPLERFARAFGAVAYHEILLLVALGAMALAAREAANPFGFLTFAVLFGARITAKLNLFLGVPRIHTGLLPDALAHLPTHFRIRRFTWFYPVSLGLLGAVLWVLLSALMGAVTAADRTGFALVTAIAALALLEHILMVVPLPDDRLWRWMLPEPSVPATPPSAPRQSSPAE
ncbi:MAG: putative photosynthetic complex assembly protein PuhE [Pseudomonadota bacterium]